MTTIHFRGDDCVFDEAFKRKIVDALRSAIDDRDVILFSGQSRQAHAIREGTGLADRPTDSVRLDSARRAFASINPAWLVCLTGNTVVLDGEDFTAEQLEAIAYLMRHDPESLAERR